jgi:hypothetical protein
MSLVVNGCTKAGECWGAKEWTKGKGTPAELRRELMGELMAGVVKIGG